VFSDAYGPSAPPRYDWTVARLLGSSSQPPTAVAGGPYAVSEGGSVALGGSGVADAARTIVGYEWDVNYDGATFDVDATRATPAFAAGGLDGPGALPNFAYDPATRTATWRLGAGAVLGADKLRAVLTGVTDVTGSGKVDGLDLVALRMRQITMLPDGEPGGVVPALAAGAAFGPVRVSILFGRASVRDESPVEDEGVWK